MHPPYSSPKAPSRFCQLTDSGSGARSYPGPMLLTAQGVKHTAMHFFEFGGCVRVVSQRA
jgi:hypothetical protein